MNKKEMFLTAIKANEGSMYKIASVYTNDIEDRNDLVQEIIYQLWKSFGTFQNKSNLSTWMYRVAMNVAIYHLKTSKRKVLTVPIEDQHLAFREVDNCEHEERWNVFKQYVGKLNLLDKGLVILYLEDKSYEEIAEIVGISASNVGTRLTRIKEKIRQQILRQS